jgi:hypothetical protein
MFLSKLCDKRTAEFLKLNRSQAQVTGLLTGHGHLQRHLFKPGVTALNVEGAIWGQAASHILCECVALAGLRCRLLAKCLREKSDYDEILLCKIRYFVRGTALLAE